MLNEYEKKQADDWFSLVFMEDSYQHTIELKHYPLRSSFKNKNNDHTKT